MNGGCGLCSEILRLLFLSCFADRDKLVNRLTIFQFTDQIVRINIVLVSFAIVPAFVYCGGLNLHGKHG